MDSVSTLPSLRTHKHSEHTACKDLLPIVRTVRTGGRESDKVVACLSVDYADALSRTQNTHRKSGKVALHFRVNLLCTKGEMRGKFL